MTICEECGKEFEGDSRKRFCNRSCAATFNNRGRRRHGEAWPPCKRCSSPSRPYPGSSGYCTRECKQEHQIELWLAGELDGCWKYSHASYVRKYLERRSGRACELCSRSWWKNEIFDGAIPLQVDHIDGDWRHNRPENLRLICPTCHAVTPNFGSANMGRGRKWKAAYSQF